MNITINLSLTVVFIIFNAITGIFPWYLAWFAFLVDLIVLSKWK